MEAVPQVTTKEQEPSAPGIAPGPTPEPELEAAESPVDAPASAANPALPVPVSEPRPRRSLWRRLTRRQEPRPSEPTGLPELVKSRPDGITLRLESFEHGLARSDARLATGFSLLERIEERLQELADVGERVDQAREAAQQAAEASASAARTARRASVVAAAAVVIALTALVVRLG